MRNLTAGNASNKRDNYDTFHISSDTRCMSELSAMMRQACEEDAKQDENSNQHVNLHHSIHMKSYTSNSTPDI